MEIKIVRVPQFMSKRKYIRAKQITPLADFEKSTSKWFEVVNGCSYHMWHYSALESLQVHTLRMWIASGRVFETKEIEQKKSEDK